jgi:N-acetylneuraminic acid mutarotase
MLPREQPRSRALITDHSFVEALECRRLFSATPAVGPASTIGASQVRNIPFANVWQTRAPAPLQRFEALRAVVGGRLYVFGGFYNSRIQVTSRADVFDPATNKWSRLPNMPGPQTHVGVATDGASIYFVGGFSGDWRGAHTPASSAFWIYHVASRTWTRGPSLPAPRAAGALALIGNTLHFVGGLEPNDKTDGADHWSYILGARGAQWVREASLPDPRNHLGYATVSGKMYVIGGQHGLVETQSDGAVHVYDPAANRWMAVASLPVPTSHLHNSTFVYQGKIICVGGTVAGDRATSNIWEYNPAANRWSALPSLPAARSATAADVSGNQMVVTTGTPTGVLPQTTTWTMTL